MFSTVSFICPLQDYQACESHRDIEAILQQEIDTAEGKERETVAPV